MFSIIEWNNSPETDLVVVRDWEDAPRRAARPARIEELGSAGMLVCFRTEEASAERSAAFQTLLAMGQVLDGTLLARVALPAAESHELSALAAHYGVKPHGSDKSDKSDKSDAPARAMAAGAVFEALVRELKGKPLGVLNDMQRLLGPVQHPLRALIEEAARLALRKGFGEAKTVRQLLPPDAGGRAARAAPREPIVPLDVEAACGMFSAEGALARAFGSYEYRPEQVRMAREVCEAFNDGLVILVEAGTGTGKSLAYLVPALLWAVKNGDPVVISTNTKNLQSQLFAKDLPFLEKALGGSFRYAMIKGRANYLCARKLMLILGAADRELTENERLELLPILTWIPATATGDVAENSGFRGGMESELWSRISTQRGECLGPRCHLSRNCFVRKARALALQSDIVVANHATVFWEAGEQSVALPPFRCIVMDEAHNLEDVATSASTVQVARWQVLRALNRLFRAQSDGAGRGLLANLRHQLSFTSSEMPAKLTEQLSEVIRASIESFPGIRGAAESFFRGLAGLFTGREMRSERIRYDADHRPEDWLEAAQAGEEFRDAVQPLSAALADLAKQCGEDEEEGRSVSGGLAEAAAEVGNQATLLNEMLGNLASAIRAGDEDTVYWIERGQGRDDASLNAAPLDIGPLMEKTIFSRARTAVFTSATLTVAGNFDFMRDRLGMRGAVSARVRETELGTSFDFTRQALLAVPSFLPEPRMDGPDFVAPFTSLAIDVLTATRGRGLVLFTSHAMLREAAPRIKAALGRQGIRVMAQGADGERSRLIGIFSRETSSVLLGTQSFWEGVDVPGESLSCLIVAKLPFRVHTDPLVSARCARLKERGRNDFAEYMVPDAAIRLKQGFGRLIRTRTDRGVVIVCDPRLVTKGYGKAFLDSLPAKPRVFGGQEALVAAVKKFLDDGNG